MDSFTIEETVLRVKDLHEMKEYYNKKLKFNIISENIRGNIGSVTLGTSQKPLLTIVSNGDEKIREKSEANLYHIAYRLPSMNDLGNFLRNAIKEKIPLTGAGDHTVSEAIYMSDPEGNGIEIYADRDKETWKWNDGYVTMGTDEVNVEELFEISDGMPEYILPIGTVIGHIHLESYDLDSYKDFYINNLKLNITSESPRAYFLSHNNYHHHFGMNQWNLQRNKPKSDKSTGLEKIVLNISRDKYKEIFNDSEYKKILLDPNKIEIDVNTISEITNI